jgi:type I restriction enzyme S subunit
VSWKNVALGDVCKVIAGQSPESINYNKEGRGLAFYQGKKDFGDVYVNPPTVWTTEITKEAIKNDILMSVRAPVGPVNIATEHICIGRGLAAIRATERINQAYLFYYLLKIEKELVGNAGAVFNSINKTQIENLLVPLPSIPTQQKIVAKLDTIFAEIDTATAASEANAKNAEALFQSYLTEVFERGGEGWIVKKLKDITEKIGSGATPRGGNESYKASGISLIRSMNVYDEGFYYPKLAFIDEAQAKELDNVKVENEDVLLNITGASVARCCVVPEDILPARVNQHVSILRAKKNIIIPKLIHYILISPVHKNKLLSVGEDGGATRQALTKAQLLEYEINFPSSLSSQLKLVEKISNFYSYTFLIKNNYDEKIRNFPSLKQSILQQAFSGELVKD